MKYLKLKPNIIEWVMTFYYWNLYIVEKYQWSSTQICFSILFFFSSLLEVVSTEVEATSGPQSKKPRNWKQLQPGCWTVAAYTNWKEKKNTQNKHQADTHHTFISIQTGREQNRKQNVQAGNLWGRTDCDVLELWKQSKNEEFILHLPWF